MMPRWLCDYIKRSGISVEDALMSWALDELASASAPPPIAKRYKRVPFPGPVPPRIPMRSVAATGACIIGYYLNRLLASTLAALSSSNILNRLILNNSLGVTWLTYCLFYSLLTSTFCVYFI